MSLLCLVSLMLTSLSVGPGRPDLPHLLITSWLVFSWDPGHSKDGGHRCDHPWLQLVPWEEGAHPNPSPFEGPI